MSAKFPITKESADLLKVKLRKKRETVTFWFVLAAILPILTVIFYYTGWLPQAGLGDDIEQAVAQIITKSGSGTAFLVTPTKLLTARHVVDDLEPGDPVELVFERCSPQRTVKATVLWKAPPSGKPKDSIEESLNDVALIAVNPITDIKSLVLGDSQDVHIGDAITCVGYPFNEFSITKGTINNDHHEGLDLFKLDAAINPGNSGGPVIHENLVVGIILGTRPEDKQGENIAITVDAVQNLLLRNGQSLMK